MVKEDLSEVKRAMLFLVYYFFHPSLFSRTLQKMSKYPWSGLYNPNQILSHFRITKSEILQSVIFVFSLMSSKVSVDCYITLG